MIFFQRLLLAGSLAASASPAFAQQPPSRAWLDIDETFDTPTQDAQAYSTTALILGEVGTATVSYPTLAKAHASAFGGGVRVYRGFGVGLRIGATQRQTTAAAITVTIPDPVFVNRPHTGRTASSLERTERTLDLQVAYLLPLPSRLGVRVFAGRSRSNITQSLIRHLTYTGPDAAGTVTIVDVTEQASKGYAWGTLVGVDAGFFLLRNVGLGVQVVRRNIDIPVQAEPFSGQSFRLSPHRTVAAAGLRLRF